MSNEHNDEVRLIPGKLSRGRFPVRLVRGDHVLLTGRVDPHTPTEVEAFITRVREMVPAIGADDLRHQLLQLAASGGGDGAGVSADAAYAELDGGLVWHRPTADGPKVIPLTNFTARIVRDVVRDDGAERTREFAIEANIAGRSHHFRVPAAQFGAMNWPLEHLGPGAVIYSGMGTRDHARCAVQIVSGRVPEHTVYSHTGWRTLPDGRTVYLHAGGAIGAEGAVDGIEVSLPDTLCRYELPPPPEAAALVESVRATLRMLDVAPDDVTVPVLAAAFRPPLGSCDASVFIAGRTGAMKSELAALAQQHYGAAMGRTQLPAAWSGTANALEGLGFAAKDALLVADDFVPQGTPQDVAALHGKAERLFRAQGNGSGRQRMRADGGLRPSKPPRGLILATGEDVPKGQSLRARMLIVDVAPGDVRTDRLTAAQIDGRAGQYAATMSGFLRWLARQVATLPDRLRQEVAELRDLAARSTTHRRTPDVVANLSVGIKYFLAFAESVDAITADGREAIWSRAWAAFGRVAARQAAYQVGSDPVTRFIDLLQAAVACGNAHLADRHGDAPTPPSAWGWRRHEGGAGADWWSPEGTMVGWVDASGIVYLEPNASYAVAQRMAGYGGDGLGVTAQTLWKRLGEAGYLVREGDRDGWKVRRQLQDAKRSVLQLRVGLFSPTKPDISAISDSEDGPTGSSAGVDGGNVRFSPEEGSAEKFRSAPGDREEVVL
ncbi:MAG TPA: hypothetical protein VF796_28250 [Humisphaera sp.]